MSLTTDHFFRLKHTVNSVKIINKLICDKFRQWFFLRMETFVTKKLKLLTLEINLSIFCLVFYYVENLDFFFLLSINGR